MATFRSAHDIIYHRNKKTGGNKWSNPEHIRIHITKERSLRPNRIFQYFSQNWEGDEGEYLIIKQDQRQGQNNAPKQGQAGFLTHFKPLLNIFSAFIEHKSGQCKTKLLQRPPPRPAAWLQSCHLMNNFE